MGIKDFFVYSLEKIFVFAIIEKTIDGSGAMQTMESASACFSVRKEAKTKGFVNTIITHITNGNKNEERLVNIMGGTVIETESERLIRKGQIAGKAEGMADERCESVKRMLRNGKTPEEISDFCGYELSYVRKVEESMRQKSGKDIYII
jgi:hypothetical protein